MTDRCRDEEDDDATGSTWRCTLPRGHDGDHATWTGAELRHRWRRTAYRRDGPPSDPLADPRPLVTRVELDRLAALRRDLTWWNVGAGREADRVHDARFLLDLVDRLLGRALLPGEDPYRAGAPDDRYEVTTGSSLYMCGHGDWYVRVRGRPGIVLSFTAGVLDACRLRDLLHGRDGATPTTGDGTG